MTHLASDLSPEQIAIYRQSALRRRAQRQAEMADRIEQAWAVARRAADMLRRDFHATRVVVFSSLADRVTFTRWSDIDIAAWGIDPADTLRAIGAAYELDRNFTVTLIDVNVCRPKILAAVESQGFDI